MLSYEEAVQKDMVPISMIDLILFYSSSVFGVAAGLSLFYRINFMAFTYLSISQEVLLNCICFAIFAFGIYTFFLNRKHFRFRFVTCNKPAQHKEDIILNIANENKWIIIKKDANYFKFKDCFTWTHWPYSITIIYDDKGFYINSLTTRFKPVDRGEGKKITTGILESINSRL